MKRIIVPAFAAISLSLGLAACGEPLDGSDTANMEPDAAAPMDSGMSEENLDAADGENPAEDGMLDTEIEPTDEPIADGMDDGTM